MNMLGFGYKFIFTYISLIFHLSFGLSDKYLYKSRAESLARFIRQVPDFYDGPYAEYQNAALARVLDQVLKKNIACIMDSSRVC